MAKSQTYYEMELSVLVCRDIILFQEYALAFSAQV